MAAHLARAQGNISASGPQIGKLCSDHLGGGSDDIGTHLRNRHGQARTPCFFQRSFGDTEFGARDRNRNQMRGRWAWHSAGRTCDEQRQRSQAQSNLGSHLCTFTFCIHCGAAWLQTGESRPPRRQRWQGSIRGSGDILPRPPRRLAQAGRGRVVIS